MPERTHGYGSNQQKIKEKRRKKDKIHLEEDCQEDVNIWGCKGKTSI